VNPKNHTVMPDSVLTVMAHPDDAELWAGGTLARCAAAGSTITIAMPRHGEAIRNTEAATAATELGATLHQLDQSTAPELRELLHMVRPEVVITHPLNDIHPDHRRIAHTLLDALPDVVIATGRPHRVYTCDTYHSLTTDGPIGAHTIIDVTEYFATKIQALRAHASQPITDHFGPMAETLGRLWGSRIGTHYAENFRPLPVLGRLPAAITL
jgi:N-acetylglucosamine malate deacetylase 1